MQFRPRLIFTFIVILFFIYFVYEAREWRLQARLYPWAIGIPMIILAITHFVLELFGIPRTKPTSDNTPVDFQFTQVADEAVARSRTITILSWIFGYVITIWFLGFSLAVPIVAFVFLRFQSGEGLGLSVALTAALWLLFWGLFVKLLTLPFPDGQLFIWLGLT